MKAMAVYNSGANVDSVLGIEGFFEPPLPFKETVKTMLGPEAIKWITAPSEDNPGKVQPHETSRVNWFKLRQMRTQAKIESELYKLGKLEPLLSKFVVASLWTMKGLATLMNPNIFISESNPHLSSFSSTNQRWNITISQGLNTHFICKYIPFSFIKVIKSLKLMLNSDTIESCDMMWVATNLAELRSIQQRHTEIPIEKVNQFEFFLSHRGKDSKKDLMIELLKKDGNNIFLDCLSLPFKLINRNFVFKKSIDCKY